MTAKSAKTITVISSVLIPMPPGTRNCSEEASSPYGRQIVTVVLPGTRRLMGRSAERALAGSGATLPEAAQAFPSRDRGPTCPCCAHATPVPYARQETPFSADRCLFGNDARGREPVTGIEFPGSVLPDHSRRLRDSGPRSFYAGMYKISRFAPCGAVVIRPFPRSCR
jgi:hypothetical protein